MASSAIAVETGGASEYERFAFTGGAREYFGIWIANIALSVITLGIYSAWAKVRRLRYFRGNTIVLGERIEYHATGMMILKGRLIVLAVFAVYGAIGSFSPTAQIVLSVALIPLYPWLLNRSLRFNARMTSWRNVRLDWEAGYWEAFRVVILWPLAAVLTLGGLVPYAARASRQFIANHHFLGRSPFAAETPVRPYYKAFFKTLGVAVLGLVAMGALGAAIVMSVFGGTAGISKTFGGSTQDYDIWITGGTYLSVLILLWFVILFAYFRALTRNIILDALEISGIARFVSDVHPWRYLWILVSNFVVIICTLFLMLPWAQIRAYGYLTRQTGVSRPADLDRFVDSRSRGVGALGQEFSEFEGIEISI